MWAGLEDVREVADMAAHLPRGGAVGEWFGGMMAVTAEVEAVWELSYISAMAATDKPKKVKPRPYPEGVRSQQRKTDYAVSMAEKFRSKHGGRNG